MNLIDYFTNYVNNNFTIVYIAHCLLPIAHCPLPIAYCPLPIEF